MPTLLSIVMVTQTVVRTKWMSLLTFSITRNEIEIEENEEIRKSVF